MGRANTIGIKCKLRFKIIRLQMLIQGHLRTKKRYLDLVSMKLPAAS